MNDAQHARPPRGHATLVVRNVRPWGGDPVDLEITDGVYTMVGRSSRAPEAEDVDGGGRLALPGLVNSHSHVDKTWWGQPWIPAGVRPDRNGRIAFEREVRDRYGIPNLASVKALLKEFLRHGVTATRTHVDVDLGLGLRGIEVVREAAESLDGAVDVEIVAFAQDGLIRRPGVDRLLERAAADGVACLGALDPVMIDKDPVAHFDTLFGIAERHGVGIDIHLHHSGDVAVFEYEQIIDRTVRAGMQGSVTISHGAGLGSLPTPQRLGLLDRIAAAGIAWSTVAPAGSVPLPWREMRERTIPIGLGTDGIRDLWSPYGDGDMLRRAGDFANMTWLRTDEDLTTAVRLATDGGASFGGRGAADFVVGGRADLLLVDAENVPDAVLRIPRRHTVLAGGRVVVRDERLQL